MACQVNPQVSFGGRRSTNFRIQCLLSYLWRIFSKNISETFEECVLRCHMIGTKKRTSLGKLFQRYYIIPTRLALSDRRFANHIDE